MPNDIVLSNENNSYFILVIFDYEMACTSGFDIVNEFLFPFSNNVSDKSFGGNVPKTVFS